jgi:hypothetical protein
VFRDRLNALDLTLFDHVETQSTYPDRVSLLALHATLAERLGELVYLELGSHRGGSLQALVADERCRKIVSIDPRPEWQPDDLVGSGGFAYPDNTTERMLENLSVVPGADVTKVETIELSSEQIDPQSIERPDFCFIDGEHTHAAVLRDARFCRAVVRGTGVIAFHDFVRVGDAIRDFMRETRGARGYLLRDEVWVVELGVPSLLTDPRIQRQLRRPARLWRPLNAVRGVRLLLEARSLRRRLRGVRGSA